MSNKIFEIYPHNFNKDKLKIEFKDSNPQEFMKEMGKWRRSYKVGEYGNYLKDYSVSLILLSTITLFQLLVSLRYSYQLILPHHEEIYRIHINFQ